MPCSRTGEGASSVCCSALLYVFGDSDVIWYSQSVTRPISQMDLMCASISRHTNAYSSMEIDSHTQILAWSVQTHLHTHTESVLSIKRPVDLSLFAISTRLIHNVWFIRLVSYASLKYCISHDGHFFCNPHLTRTQLEIQSALFIQNQARIDFFFFLFNLTVC